MTATQAILIAGIIGFLLLIVLTIAVSVYRSKRFTRDELRQQDKAIDNITRIIT